MNDRAWLSHPAVDLSAEVVRAWDRQADESELSYRGFTFYVEASRPRQLAEVARYLRIPMHQTIDLATANDWRARVRAYDEFVDRSQQQEFDEILGESERDIALRNLSLVRTASELAKLELSKLLVASRESEAPMIHRQADTIKMLDASVKLERLIRGQATEIFGKAAPTLDLSTFTLEEIEAFQVLAAKAGFAMAGPEMPSVAALPASSADGESPEMPTIEVSGEGTDENGIT